MGPKHTVPHPPGAGWVRACRGAAFGRAYALALVNWPLSLGNTPPGAPVMFLGACGLHGVDQGHTLCTFRALIGPTAKSGSIWVYSSFRGRLNHRTRHSCPPSSARRPPRNPPASSKPRAENVRPPAARAHDPPGPQAQPAVLHQHQPVPRLRDGAEPGGARGRAQAAGHRRLRALRLGTARPQALLGGGKRIAVRFIPAPPRLRRRAQPLAPRVAKAAATLFLLRGLPL